MVYIINRGLSYSNNNAVFLTNKKFFNSERHLNKIMNTRHKNPGFIILISSIYNLYWINRLDVDFEKIGISPKFLIGRTPLIRSLKITVDDKYFDHFLQWSDTLELLSDLNLKFESEKKKGIKLSSFPKNLERLTLISLSPLEMDEHQNLSNISVLSCSKINLDNLPKLKRFEINNSCIEQTICITCSSKRCYDLFKLPHRSQVTGDSQNIFYYDKFGKITSPSNTIDIEELLELGHGDRLDENIYATMPYIDRVSFYDENILVEHCEGNKNIKEIFCSLNNAKKFVDYFENLETIHIESVDNIDEFWKFVKNTKVDIEYYNERSNIFYYKKEYEEIPSNLIIDVQNFSTDDLDSLFFFVDRLGLEYFTISSNSKFDSKWFEKYNYAKERTRYFLQENHIRE
jgi:hypothetical protein